ncbi:MAG TPA: hypothetical protein VLQ79_07680 [Myxococcaceae bacterium]|nr:hypothetical protein [Myxococcaceae bacterium]
MKTQNDRNENSSWMRVRSVAAGFLCVMGLPVALALADVQTGSAAASTPAISQSVPASMHVAQAGDDTGPGSDEALLAMVSSQR